MLFLVLAFVLLCFVAYDIYSGVAIWWMALGGLAVGLVIGFIYGRLARVRWHETEEKIVRQNDVFAYVLIAAYIALSWGRDVLLGDILSGAALTAVSLAVASGVLIGRFIGMHIVLMRTIKAGRPKA